MGWFGPNSLWADQWGNHGWQLDRSWYQRGIAYGGNTVDPTTFAQLPFRDDPGGLPGVLFGDSRVEFFSQSFEVHVVCLEGREKGAVYGGVAWGHSFTELWGRGTSINDFQVSRWARPITTPSSDFVRIVRSKLF
jgi:hypothetical protein